MLIFYRKAVMIIKLKFDNLNQKVSELSGGQRKRLSLATLLINKPDLLILDEPTNHFDIEMREALALALQDYDGAVLLVAHDKNLMESVVDEFWLVNDGQVNPFNGDLNDYQKWLNENINFDHKKYDELSLS